MKNLNTNGEMPKAGEGFYKDGKKYGVFLKYDKKKRLIGSYTYQADVLNGAFEEYFPDTMIVSKKGYFKEGLLHGTVYDFYENNQVARESQYQLGKLNGCMREFDEDGTISRIIHYRDDKLNGSYEKFSHGRISWAGIYRNGNVVVMTRDIVYLAAHRSQLERDFQYQ